MGIFNPDDYGKAFPGISPADASLSLKFFKELAEKINVYEPRHRLATALAVSTMFQSFVFGHMSEATEPEIAKLLQGVASDVAETAIYMRSELLQRLKKSWENGG